MRWLKLVPSNGPFFPHDERAFPLYDYCQEHDLPVVFHTGESLPVTPSRFSNPLEIQDVQINFPRLKIVAAHAGAKIWWDEALSLAAHTPSVFLELSVWIWDDTTEEEQEAVVRKIVAARDRVGAERIMFGTDHVSGNRTRGPDFQRTVAEWFRSLPERAKKLGARFSDAEMDLILRDNARWLIGDDGN
jgi:predicted TIM-barrel fold metal-dependent hydrolase